MLIEFYRMTSKFSKLVQSFLRKHRLTVLRKALLILSNVDSFDIFLSETIIYQNVFQDYDLYLEEKSFVKTINFLLITKKQPG